MNVKTIQFIKMHKQRPGEMEREIVFLEGKTPCK